MAWPWEILLIILPFMWLYGQTMPPGISSWIVKGWDSAMLQVTGSTWGIPHSPGYPLYTILSNLFVRWLNGLPYLMQTDYAWRVTAWSTTTSLLTLLLTYFTVWRITRDRVLALTSGIVLGVSFIFWRAAIMAEVYSFNALIFVLTYWLLLVWLERQHWGYLVILGLVLGAGVVHHRTALILPPMAALGVVITSWSGGPRPWLSRLSYRLPLLVGCATLPLLTYLYLFWASHTRVGQTWLYAREIDWQTFWFILTSREWWGLVQPPQTSLAWLNSLRELFHQQAAQISPVGVTIGLLGVILMNRHWWLLGIPLLGLTYFGVTYDVPDVDSMLIPLTLTLVIGGAITLSRTIDWLVRRAPLVIYLPGFRRRWTRLVIRLLFVAALVIGTYILFRPLAEANYQAVDLSDDWQAEDLLEEVIAIAQAGTPVTIIGQDNSVLPDFIYAKTVRQQNVEPLSTTTLSRQPVTETQRLLYDRLAQNQRLFVDRETIDLTFLPWLNQAIASGDILLAPTGHPFLWELLPRPMRRPPPPNEAWIFLAGGQFLAGDLSIIAYHERIIHKRTGCFLRLTLFWQANAPISDDYFIAYQPLGGESVIDKVDHLALMRGHLPTSALQPGELVRDEVDLLIRQPQDLPLINLVVNLYQVEGNAFPSFGEVTLPVVVSPTGCG